MGIIRTDFSSLDSLNKTFYTYFKLNKYNNYFSWLLDSFKPAGGFDGGCSLVAERTVVESDSLLTSGFKCITNANREFREARVRFSASTLLLKKEEK